LKKLVKILSPVIIIVGLYFIFKEKEVIQPPGILAPNNPKQSILKNQESWIIDDYNYYPIAQFEIEAKVLSIRFYGSDEMSEFCPVDLALGWGKMSDQSIVDRFEIKQQHRWYVWRTENFPIPQKEVEMSSSNFHIIPANEKVEDILDDVLRGNIISIKGKLVNVNEIGEKFIYKSSTQRDDTGGGACEILWLEDISIKM
jgi:hypothetical protein